MAARSGWLGRGISTWRSKRPGRSSAGSRTSGRLVAARTTTPVAGSKPSISASSWLRVCSRSSLETDRAAPPLADGVDLVDEDDRGGPLAGVREEVPHPGRPDADEHLDEARPGDGEEGHLGLARHGPGQEGLAGTGRPDHQDAPGPDRAGSGVALGVLQEVDHLADLLLGTLVAGDVGEARRRPLLVEHLRLGTADAHDPACHLPAGAPAQPYEEPDEDEERQERQQVAHEVRARTDARDGDAMTLERRGELRRR